jgi:hypothetical protein
MLYALLPQTREKVKTNHVTSCLPENAEKGVEELGISHRVPRRPSWATEMDLGDTLEAGGRPGSGGDIRHLAPATCGRIGDVRDNGVS